jgi:hypothetical protein
MPQLKVNGNMSLKLKSLKKSLQNSSIPQIKQQQINSNHPVIGDRNNALSVDELDMSSKVLEESVN